MPAEKTQAKSDGFSAEERAAMKERAAELRAEGKKGAKKADGLAATAPWASRRPPTSTTGTYGPCRTRCRNGAPSSSEGSSNW